MLQHARRLAFLHLLAFPHHDDTVGDLGDHAHVMGDEDDGHALFFLQELDELEDLGLDGDIERGRRLVGDQDLGLAGERHGDHDALAHAAREAVRIFVQALARGRHAHPLQDAQRLRLAPPPARVRDGTSGLRRSGSRW